LQAEAGAIGESDPAFSAFITMSAFKFSYLTQVSREMIEDSGVDILGFLADQVGQGIGFNVNSKLTTGTGTPSRRASSARRRWASPAGLARVVCSPPTT
jgi:HK97 family phage major capsid protein